MMGMMMINRVETMQWQDHEDNASEWGGHLISISSAEELDMVMDLSKGAACFVGGMRHTGKLPNEKGNLVAPSEWGWADGSSWRFEAWATGAPPAVSLLHGLSHCEQRTGRSITSAMQRTSSFAPLGWLSAAGWYAGR